MLVGLCRPFVTRVILGKDICTRCLGTEGIVRLPPDTTLLSIADCELLGAWHRLGPQHLEAVMDQSVRKAALVLTRPIGFVPAPLSNTRLLTRLAMRQFTTQLQLDALWTMVARAALGGDRASWSMIVIELAQNTDTADLALQWCALRSRPPEVRKMSLEGRHLLRRRPRLKRRS